MQCVRARDYVRWKRSKCSDGSGIDGKESTGVLPMGVYILRRLGYQSRHVLECCGIDEEYFE